MFIGYLKNGFEDYLEDLISKNPLLDLELLKQTYNVYPQYCFAAYENSKIVGVLSAYSFDSYLYVNVIEVMSSYEDILKRLVSLLIRNFPSENIVILIENKSSKELENIGFQERKGMFIYRYKIRDFYCFRTVICTVYKHP